MATRRITTISTTGWNVYAIVQRLSDGKCFDWNDNTWKTLAGATTPGVALTSLASYGGSQSLFGADLNLSTINATATPVDVQVSFQKRAGVSPAPATDTLFAVADPFSIVNGGLVALGGQGFKVDVTANLTTTSGVNMHFTVELIDADGATVPLHTIDSGATCAIEVTQDATSTGGARVPQFSLSTTDCGSVNADHRFEIQYSNPNLTANRGFTAAATVVSGGVTYHGSCKFFS
jgi:hypothetical protein